MEDKLANNTALSNEEKKKLLVKRLVLLIAAVVMLVITIFAFSKAWFTSNTDVSAEGMSVQAGDTLFSIATKGNDPLNSDVFEKIDATAYAEGTAKDGYYISDTNTLMLRATSGNEATVEPGSSGTVEFYVIPKASGGLTINITLNVVGYVAVAETDGDNNTVCTYKKASELTTSDKLYKSETEDPTAITTETLAEIQKAEQYLQGHILFFENKAADTDNFQYSDFISPSDNTITCTKSLTGLSANQPSDAITIYWTWPDTIGNLAATYPSFINGTSVVNKSDTNENSDLNRVRTYLVSNITNVFKITDSNGEDITENSITKDTINGIDGGYNTNPITGDATNYELLTTAYNNADSLIGKNINCFMIEVTVSEGGGS